MNKKCWKSIGPDGELNSSQRPFSKAHDMENTTTSLCVSFVILTWNSESYIKSCICSIVLALENSPLSYEIFIVDNGSKDNTKKELNQLENLYPDLVRLIFLESNMGTTYSRNLAIKRSIGDHICIMDSDVELIPGTIEKLIQHFGNDPQAGLIAPKMVYPNKKLQKSTDYFPTVTRKVLRYFFLRQIEAKELVQAKSLEPIAVDYAVSALWLLKRKIVQDVGLLDENIFYAPEDVDYCLRIWKGGYKVIYDTSVSAVHHTQEISRGFKFNKAFFMHIKGLLYYFLKHRYFFIKPSFDN